MGRRRNVVVRCEADTDRTSNGPPWQISRGARAKGGLGITHATAMLRNSVAEVKRLRSVTEFGGRAEMWLRSRHKEESPQL